MKCKWYSVCPLRHHERQGLIDEQWRNNYCRGNYESCLRYQKEKKGLPHSDLLLPDGSYLDTRES